MGEQRGSMIDRIVHGIEERVDDWRRRDAALKMEAEANRDALWAEATERERLLVEALGSGEAERDSVEEVSREQRLVFVMHSEETARALRDFAREGDRLMKIVPRTSGFDTRVGGMQGSRLVFEAPDA